MAKINWELVWNNSLKNKEIFPVTSTKNNAVSVSCPTRFSNVGKFSIEISPSFNDSSIVLELLTFNDNVTLKDLPKDVKISNIEDNNEFNRIADRLMKYELSKRIMERFKIKSDGFDSDKDAEEALVDYINNKATESGRMFDDKLDELNDSITSKNKSTIAKEEDYVHILESIRDNRRFILKKVESILKSNYKWKASKNEEFGDSTASFYDANGNLAAVVSLADNFLVVDLAKDITAKVSLLQSDEEIEAELTDDIDNAQQVLADREIEQLKDVVSNEEEVDEIDEEEEYLEELSRKITKLENLYISRRLRKF